MLLDYGECGNAVTNEMNTLLAGRTASARLLITRKANVRLDVIPLLRQVGTKE